MSIVPFEAPSLPAVAVAEEAAMASVDFVTSVDFVSSVDFVATVGDCVLAAVTDDALGVVLEPHPAPRNIVAEIATRYAPACPSGNYRSAGAQLNLTCRNPEE